MDYRDTERDKRIKELKKQQEKVNSNSENKILCYFHSGAESVSMFGQSRMTHMTSQKVSA